jgi:hypothetical protein
MAMAFTHDVRKPRVGLFLGGWLLTTHSEISAKPANPKTVTEKILNRSPKTKQKEKAHINTPIPSRGVTSDLTIRRLLLTATDAKPKSKRQQTHTTSH